MRQNSSDAAAKCLGHHHGGVVGRLGDQPLDGVLDLEAVAGFDAELGRRLARRLLGNRHHGVERDLAGLQAFEQQVQRHDLGQRRRVARGVGIGGMQHTAVVGVDHDGGVGRVIV